MPWTRPTTAAPLLAADGKRYQAEQRKPERRGTPGALDAALR
jgi:hypothetical protein